MSRKALARMASIQLDHISKVYADGTVAVSDLSLDVADGEFMVLVGPSGCGKTTALRMVAGLEEVSAGTIRIDERDVTRVSSKDRDIAMVFQNYALYPHLTVAENMGFSLSLRKVDKRAIRTRVAEAAGLLGIEAYLDRKPRQLSGGQRQRVAMGRAIVREPQAFLMDEPLSNLDAKLRVQMRAEVARIQQRLNTTTLYVTHDQTEAMTMGDRVAVMKKGVLQQVDAPDVLYDRPVNLFVGGFIGSPAMNLFEAEVRRVDEPGRDERCLRFGSHEVPVPAEVLEQRPALQAYDGRKIVLGIRPESMEDAALLERPPNALVEAKAELVERTGADVYVHFRLDAPTVLTEDTRDLLESSGKDLEPLEREEAGAECVARVGAHTQISEGDLMSLAIDASRMQMFDMETGLAIWRDPEGGSASDTHTALEEVR